MSTYEKLQVIKKDIAILEQREREAEKAVTWSFARKEYHDAEREIKELNDIGRLLEDKRAQRDELQIELDKEWHQEAVEVIS